MVEPLCPECRKKMAAHWTCDHCGFDPNRTKSKERLVVLPYKCVRCQKPTQKKIEDIPVCGDCFTEGWGRLPDMRLDEGYGKPLETVAQPEDVTKEVLLSPDDPIFQEPSKETKVFKCPECSVKPFKSKQRLNKHKTKIHGG